MSADGGRFPLPSLDLFIASRPELAFQLVSAVGQGPDAAHARVLERPASDLAIVEFTTSVLGRTVRTVEEVRFIKPDRITYRLLRGPLPQVEEEFVFEPEGSGVRLRYRGHFRAHPGWLRTLIDRLIVPAVYRRAVRKSMEQIKAAAEARQARSRLFPQE